VDPLFAAFSSALHDEREDVPPIVEAILAIDSTASTRTRIAEGLAQEASDTFRVISGSSSDLVRRSWLSGLPPLLAALERIGDRRATSFRDAYGKIAPKEAAILSEDLSPASTRSLHSEAPQRIAKATQVSENWWNFIVSPEGVVSEGSKGYGAAESSRAWVAAGPDAQSVLIQLRVEPNAEDYLSFTQCKILYASGKPVELSAAQKHGARKYFSTDYNTELHWQRAPQIVKELFSASQVDQCGDTHEWDGCICKRCGKTRPHDWGEVVECDMSKIGGKVGVVDSHGVVKTLFIKTCRNCQKQETVRTVYQEPEMTDDEMVATLGQLCSAYMSSDRAAIQRLEPKATAIGEESNRRGGIGEMRRVFDLLGSIPGSRTLEMHWNGIGDWRG
jgi:hypothetical protein